MKLVPIKYAWLPTSAEKQPEDETNLLFGNSVIHITVEDEGGGPFVIIEAINEEHKLRLDFTDVSELAKATNKIEKQFKKEQHETEL